MFALRKPQLIALKPAALSLSPVQVLDNKPSALFWTSLTRALELHTRETARSTFFSLYLLPFSPFSLRLGAEHISLSLSFPGSVTKGPPRTLISRDLLCSLDVYPIDDEHLVPSPPPPLPRILFQDCRPHRHGLHPRATISRNDPHPPSDPTVRKLVLDEESEPLE